MTGQVNRIITANQWRNFRMIELHCARSSERVRATVFSLPAYTDVLILGHPRFFLGSDSAPHPSDKKATSTPACGCAAGIYTQPILLPLVAHLLESFGALDKMNGFVGEFGRSFYKIPSSVDAREVVLTKTGPKSIAEHYTSSTLKVIPFWAGKELEWEIENKI